MQLALTVALIFFSAAAGGFISEPPGIRTIQKHNYRTLIKALQQGYSAFCNADVDEGVIALFPGSDPHDGTLELLGCNNTLPLMIKDVNKLVDFGFDVNKKTLILVNGFVFDATYEIKQRLQYLQNNQPYLNIIVINFSTQVLQLYNSAKHNVYVLGYFISKVLGMLVRFGVNPDDIILSGYSQGAHIAALGAKLFSDERKNKIKLPYLIAIDPAIPCSSEHQYVNANVCNHVLVIHGENCEFSISEPVGTIDVYPNGENNIQPGCTTQTCSHVFPLLLFLEALSEKEKLMAVRCNDWLSFLRGQCSEQDILQIGLDIPKGFKGRYYCVTNSLPPYNLGSHGLRRLKF